MHSFSYTRKQYFPQCITTYSRKNTNTYKILHNFDLIAKYKSENICFNFPRVNVSHGHEWNLKWVFIRSTRTGTLETYTPTYHSLTPVQLTALCPLYTVFMLTIRLYDQWEAISIQATCTCTTMMILYRWTLVVRRNDRVSECMNNNVVMIMDTSSRHMQICVYGCKMCPKQQWKVNSNNSSPPCPWGSQRNTWWEQYFRSVLLMNVSVQNYYEFWTCVRKIICYSNFKNLIMINIYDDVVGCLGYTASCLMSCFKREILRRIKTQEIYSRYFTEIVRNLWK